MRVVKLSTYEAGEMERYLKDYLKMRDFYYKNRKTNESKFNSLEYDKDRIDLLIRRLNGEDYKEDYWKQRREYKESMYPDGKDLEDDLGILG